MESGMWTYLGMTQQVKLLKDLMKEPTPEDIANVRLTKAKELMKLDSTLTLEQAIELASKLVG